MAIELVTGYAGAPHVTSAQDGRRNAAAWGTGSVVLNIGDKFALTVNSATSVTVGTGDAMMEGRHVTSEAPTDLTVSVGTSGMNRVDLVCIKYEKDADTGVESASLVVVEGVETSGTPTAPTVETGAIMTGGTVSYFPLWKLTLNGINAPTKAQMFTVPSILTTDNNATYSLGYTASSRVLKLTGANGGSSSQVTLPNATASAAGLMTAALFNKLSAMGDYIVEVGSNSSTSAAMQWRWLKFNSGYAVAWGYRLFSLTATNAWGSLFYGNMAAQSTPFTWANAPYEWANLQADGYYWLVSHNACTTTKTGSYYATTATKQTTARTGYFEVLHFGRWK